MVRAQAFARARPRSAAALVLAIFIAPQGAALGAAPPQVLDSRIARVTVYRNVAQVTRLGSVTLEPGVHVVAIDHLPLRTQLDALDCRLEGDGRVLGLKIEARSVLPDSVSPERAGALQAMIAEIDRGITNLDAELRVLEQKKEFLTGVRNEAPKALVRPATAQSAATIEVGLRRTLDFVADEWLAMENAILALGRRKAALAERREAVQADLKRTAAPVTVETRHQANIEIEMKSRGQVEVALSYMVSGAEWRTYHDARLDQARSSLEWSSFAEIRQTTGEDWSNVELTVSTADLDAGKAIPEIEPIVLTSPPHLRETGVIQGKVCDSRTGRPIPYANVVLLGTDVGTLTGEDGTYTIRDAPPGVHAMQVSYVGYGTANRKEVAVVAGSQVQSDFALQDNEVSKKEILIEAKAALVSKERADTHHVVRSETHREVPLDGAKYRNALSAGVEQAVVSIGETATGAVFRIERRETVPSDGSWHRATIAVHDFPVELEIVTVPRHDRSAYLRARGSNPAPAPLLPGPVHLFSDRDYLGKAELTERVSPGASLLMSFGRHERIEVARTLVDQSRGQSRGDDELRYHYRIQVKNFDRRVQRVLVLDQVPVAVDKRVRVDLLAIAPAPVGGAPDPRGELRWALNVEPGAEAAIELEYLVRCPREFGLAGL